MVQAGDKVGQRRWELSSMELGMKRPPLTHFLFCSYFSQPIRQVRNYRGFIGQIDTGKGWIQRLSEANDILEPNRGVATWV